MKKVILILDGVNGGKTAFIDVVKTNGFWTWNVNRNNVLSFLSYKIGWSGEKNKQYYEFLNEFETLAEKYFDFENWYMHQRIDGFTKNEKVNLLIIHKCSESLRYKLEDEFSNLYTVNIVDMSSEYVIDDTVKYDYTLNCKSDNYNNDIFELMKMLTDDVVEKEEVK